MGSFEDRKATGTVFNIQKYSVHDGPGIRTIVFLKGCPLSCKWCSNPESQASHPQVAYNKGRCIGCHRCIKACEHDAITVNEDARSRSTAASATSARRSTVPTPVPHRA
jgi:pyruvate formate lyase activating enzyme